MRADKKSGASNLRTIVSKLTWVHFMYGGIYAINVLVNDLWDLYTPETLATRWLAGALIVSVVGIIGYAANVSDKSKYYYQKLIYYFIALDIIIAGFGVYMGRGMASRSVALFFIPIIVAAVALKPAHIYKTTFLSALAYALAAKLYFMAHPSEGYKVELYSDLFFYSASFFVAAVLLSTLVKNKDLSK